jgi:NADH-ubiquinone oxidoreductase chain 5
MFLGWEGVGLCSYLFINFWFRRVQAMIINTIIGDFSLMIGILIMFVSFKSVDYATIAFLNTIFLNATYSVLIF